jgi:TM2 domain-containing membrane protein YozV
MYQQNQYQQQPYNSDIVTPDKLTLEPAIACLLSVFVAGLGQMINGQIEKGLIILLGGMAIIFVVTLVTCGIGALLSPVLIAFSAIDAYKCAQRLQNGQCLGKYEFHIFD